ncbi:hypothetical protein KKC45_02205, partial [Patescibacteria group bacterium]|nr:hypothetical protein [Patescibacteria group bacterium]
ITILLFFLNNKIGEKTKFLGYTTTADLLNEGGFGYNIFLRILSPAIFISVISVTLYFFNFKFLITNIWLVAIWYSLLRIAVVIFFNRFGFLNKFLFIGVHLGSIFIAYLFYELSLSRGVEFILPENSNFRTEIWFIIFIYIYHLLNNLGNGDNDYYRKHEILKKRYLIYQKKFKKVLQKEFIENNFLNKTLFSIMIMEDINRPKTVRILEKILKAKTTGIMQINSDKHLDDVESVKLAQEKILTAYKKNKSGVYNYYDLLRSIAKSYNADDYYIGSIFEIFRIIDEKDSLYKQIEKKSKTKAESQEMSPEVIHTFIEGFQGILNKVGPLIETDNKEESKK